MYAFFKKLFITDSVIIIRAVRNALTKAVNARRSGMCSNQLSIVVLSICGVGGETVSFIERSGFYVTTKGNPQNSDGGRWPGIVV